MSRCTPTDPLTADRRALGRHRPVEVVDRRALGELGADDRRVALEPDPRRLLQRGGERRQRRRRLEVLRQRADRDAVGLAGDLELALGGLQRRGRRREARLALADVGAGHLADVEAVLRGTQRLVQPVDVVAGEPDELLVLQHVDIGGDGVEQHQRLDGLEVGAPGRDRVARRLDRRLGLAVVVDHELGVQRRLHRAELLLGQLDDVGLRRGGDPDVDLRAAVGAGLRHALVETAQRRPVRIEQRAGLVGLDQRVGQRLGARHAGRQQRRQRARQQQSSSVGACTSVVPGRCSHRCARCHRASATALSGRAEDLLVLARADEGGVPLHRTPVAPAEVLASVARRFGPRAAEHGRALHVAPSDSERIAVDRLRVEQALGNLVDNALRHGAGTVSLAAEPRDGAIVFRVADEGAGFPPEFLPRAFERFARADDARGGGSAGLGLAIAREIARSHGGDVRALNSSTRGAVVTLSVPIREPSVRGEDAGQLPV